MSENRIIVLLIEDNPGDARLIQEMLAERPIVPYGLECADRLSTGLERLAKDDVHVVLLDLNLPDSQGLDTFNEVLAQAPTVPILVLTGLDDEMLAMQAARQGAQDYLTKGEISSRVLWRVIRYAVERKRTEKALRQSEEKYKTLFESKLDGVVVIDETMRPLLANQAAVDIFGFDSMTALLGADPFHFIPPEERERAFTIVANDMLQGDLRQVNEFQLLNKAGEQIWISAIGARIQYQGKPAGLVSFRDITERKRVEEALRRSEEKYRNLVESMTDVIYSLDTEGHVISVNKAVTAMLGFQPEEVIGMKFAQFVAKEVMPHTIADFERVRMGEETARETTVTGKHGERHVVEFTSTPIRKDGKTVGSQGIVRDITKRKKIEEALRQSEERYRTILEEMQDVYFETDVAGNFTFFNDVISKLTGYSGDELMGINYRAYIAPEDVENIYRIFNQVYRTGKPVKAFSCRTIRKDRSIGFTESSGSPLRNEAGEIIGFRGVNRDITERKLVEEALRQSEERYRTILDDMEGGYYEVDIAGNFTFANDAMCRHLGYSRQETIGMNNQAYMDEENAKLVYETYNKVYRLGKPAKWFSWELIRKNGDRRFVEVSVYPLLNEAGEIIGFRGICNDITERKKAEEALRESNERYSSLINDVIDSSAVGLFILDADFKVVWVNRALATYFGLQRDKVIGKDKRTLIREHIKHMFEQPEIFAEKVLATYDNNTYVERFECHMLSDGKREERWLEHRSQPIRSGLYSGGRIEHYYDITHRKQAEEALRALAAQAEKTAAISTLAGGIAHELNNPMMGMLNFAQYCLKHTDRDDRRYPVLEDIVTETKRCVDIVQDLLTFSHMQKGTPEKRVKASLNEITDRVIRLLAYRIGKGHVSVTCHIPKGTPEIWMQPHRIQEVLLNLISNALNAVEDTEKKEIHVQVRRDGEFVQVAVADTGHGIAPENLDRLFDPFFTTKAAGEGTGLGLSVTRSIIDEHGGNITCHSRPGVGTTFKVLLPIERRQEEATQ